MNSELRIRKLIEAFGGYDEQIILGDIIISPVDKRPEYDSTATQRFALNYDQSVTSEIELNESFIAGLLALVTGRPVHELGMYYLESQDSRSFFANGSGNLYEKHPNFGLPFLDEEMTRPLHIIGDKIRKRAFWADHDSMHKFQSIMRAVSLYKSSLVCARFDLDAAFCLLVAAGDCFGQTFSNKHAKFENIPYHKSLIKVFEENSLSQSVQVQIQNAILSNGHYRHQAKFTDGVLSRLDDKFYTSPAVKFVPIVSQVRNKSDYSISNSMIQGWTAYPTNLWPSTRKEVKAMLFEAYEFRSKYLHAGHDLPFRAKIGQLLPFDNAKADKASKRGRLVPNYFWLERVINYTLIKALEVEF